MTASSPGNLPVTEPTSSAKRTARDVLPTHTGQVRPDQLIALATAVVLGGGVAVAATTTSGDRPAAAPAPAPSLTATSPAAAPSHSPSPTPTHRSASPKPTPTRSVTRPVAAKPLFPLPARPRPAPDPPPAAAVAAPGAPQPPLPPPPPPPLPRAVPTPAAAAGSAVPRTEAGGQDRRPARSGRGSRAPVERRPGARQGHVADHLGGHPDRPHAGRRSGPGRRLAPAVDPDGWQHVGLVRRAFPQPAAAAGAPSGVEGHRVGLPDTVRPGRRRTTRGPRHAGHFRR